MLIALQVTAQSLGGQQAHGLDIVLLLEIYIDFLLSCVLPPSLFPAKMWRYNSDLGCCLWSHLVVLSILCPLHTNMSLVLLLVCYLKLLSFFLVLSYAYNISSFETACSITAVWFPFVWKDSYHLLVIVTSSDSVCQAFLLNFVLAFLYCTYMLLFCLIFYLVSCAKSYFSFLFFFTFLFLLSELFVCLLPQLLGAKFELVSWCFSCLGGVTVFSSDFSLCSCVFLVPFLKCLSWYVFIVLWLCRSPESQKMLLLATMYRTSLLHLL